MPNQCSWDDCYKRARTPYQIILCEHPRHVRCSLVDNPPPGYYYGRHYHYAFCSENCLDYWRAPTGKYAQETADLHRGVIYGNHTPGMRRGR